MPKHVPPMRPTLPVKTSSFHPVTNFIVVERMNVVPGFKTSAAFFSFLRANLVLLPPSTLNSNTSTPLLYPSSSQTLPLLFPSSLATMTSNVEGEIVPTIDPLEGVPPLVTQQLIEEEDKIAALKLIADSIAQQRQIASRVVIFHPITLAAYVLILAIASQFIYRTRSDIGIMATTTAGITMACLIATRGFTSGYLTLAEEFNWKFATNEDGEEDIIIGSRYGGEIMGALILRLERNGNGGGKKKTKSAKTGGKGVARAWTVRLRYRGKGVGTELLEEAVRITREKLGNSAEIGFAAEHANSKMILPEIFNATFRKREARAAKALEKVVESMDTGSKKKR